MANANWLLNTEQKIRAKPYTEDFSYTEYQP